ncbi:hypothetical protein I3843_07G168300 [Carya illinoinensis]|nr:hypothetical protein I3843_07G168300 [Carya illinoinensis]
MLVCVLLPWKIELGPTIKGPIEKQANLFPIPIPILHERNPIGTPQGFSISVSEAEFEHPVPKGVDQATASAILAAYTPDLAPFMSDEVYAWDHLCGHAYGAWRWSGHIFTFWFGPQVLLL